jgi:hypothetical protein
MVAWEALDGGQGFFQRWRPYAWGSKKLPRPQNQLCTSSSLQPEVILSVRGTVHSYVLLSATIPCSRYY